MSNSPVQRLSASPGNRCRSRVIPAALLLLIPGVFVVRGAEEANSVWPNTLRLQPLVPGSEGRDIIKLRAYDHIGSPSCSHDGRWASFDAFKIVSPEKVSSPECFIVRLDGTGLSKLAEGTTPRLSPDGKRLLFMREGQGDPDKDLGVFVIDRDGTGKRRIGSGRWPDWSPDASQVAYSRGGPDGGGATWGPDLYRQD